MYFQLYPSTPRIDVIGSGSWHILPTPQASDSYNENRGITDLAKMEHPTDLARFIQRGLLPTPSVSDVEGAPKRPDQIKQNESGGWTRTADGTGVTYGAKLQDVVGLLPTPREAASRGNCSNDRGKGNLEDVIAKMGLLPTPTQQDARIGPDNIGGSQHRAERGSVALADVALGLLPTPAIRDYKGARTTESLENAGRNHTNSLPDSFAQTGRTSQLSVLFVSEMMSFPLDWLVLPFQNGELKE